MAVRIVDFQLVKLLPIVDGIEFFGGWLHTMMFYAFLPTVSVNDDILLTGRVPVDEDWQVLGLSNLDLSATVPPQGWQQQQLQAFLPFASINAVVGDPKPTGQMAGVSQFFPVWSRGWDGVTHVQWGDYGAPVLEPLVLRPCDPTWSVHRWPAGMLWRIASLTASKAGSSGSMSLTFIVLRMPRGIQGLDVRRPLNMLDAALKALQETARREVLRD